MSSQSVILRDYPRLPGRNIFATTIAVTRWKTSRVAVRPEMAKRAFVNENSAGGFARPTRSNRRFCHDCRIDFRGRTALA